MIRTLNACEPRPFLRPTTVARGLSLLLPFLIAGGCAANRAGTDGTDASSSARGTPEPEQNQPNRTPLSVVQADDRAVVIGGSTLGWSSLRTPLTEAAGAMVLEEVVLDRALEREAARRGLTVGEAEIRAEEESLLDELTSVGSGQNRMEVLAQIRRSRGLGPARYDALLKRNALLRTLVRESSEPEAAELELARRLAFGETQRVRLFVSASESEAARMRAEVMSGSPETRRWIFAEQAGRTSSHPSGVRGGLIDRFHAEDPAYPSILGNAVRSLRPGEVSPVLATAAGFAVVLVEAVEPGRSPEVGEAERVARRVRQRKERLAMERVARELIGNASVSPIDPDLARAWRDRQ